MKNIVLFGGNGYLGRNFIRNWLKHDHDVRFYVLSRSGRDQLKLPEVIDVRVDVSSAENVLKAIPDHVGYIVDFIGAPEKDPTKFDQIIWVPARVMRQVAESLNCQAMGFVGGVLGPKKFTATKKRNHRLFAPKLSSVGNCRANLSLWKWPQRFYDANGSITKSIRDFFIEDEACSS